MVVQSCLYLYSNLGPRQALAILTAMSTLLALLARLPLPLLHGTGVLLGWLAYRLDRRYAGKISDNLRLSQLAPNPRAYRRLRRTSIAEHGKGALELLVAWGRPPAQVAALVRHCTGWEHVTAATLSGKGILFLTPHLGAYDIAGRYLERRLPILAMYRPPKLRWLEPLMVQGRARDQGDVVSADSAGVRRLFKTLRAGGNTIILPDQVPGEGDGVWAPFLGRPAYTMTLASRLAHATGATVLLFYGERLRWGQGYHLHIQPLETPFTGDKTHDATLLNHAIAGLIRQCPGQYLWSYNRFKTPAGAPPAPESDRPAC
jgi:KDO2-lipid IV(A) lauroyltransferase